MRFTNVRLVEEYEAWFYDGGDLETIDPKLKDWLSHYGLRYVSKDQDAKTIRDIERMRERFPEELKRAWSYLRSEPREQLVWMVDGATIACFPGMYIVQTELGPCAFTADEVEEK